MSSEKRWMSFQPFSRLVPPLKMTLSPTEAAVIRNKVLGATMAGRVLIGVWTPREDKVRAVTAYPASRAYRKLFRETQ